MTAAFPASAVLDDFNRPDEDPLSGAGRWVSVIGNGFVLPKVHDNQCVTQVGPAPDNIGAVWADSSDWADAEIFCDVLDWGAGALGGIIVNVRSNLGTTAGYGVFFADDSISIFNNDSAHPDGQSWSRVTAPGSSIGVRVVGATVGIYVKDPGHPWQQVGEHVCAFLPASGYVALNLNNSMVIDNFGAGQLQVGVQPNLSGFVAAAKRLRHQFGSTCVFHVPVTPQWPSGTKINPDTGQPYDATVVRQNAAFIDVPKRVLVILKQGSPLRPQADTHWDEVGLMSGMDIIIDLDGDDYPEVRLASEFTIATLTYKVEEAKPFQLGGNLYRWLIYGMER